MTRYLFIPDAKNGKQVSAGIRGTLVSVTDDKAIIKTPLPILTEKPAVTDYVAPVAPKA